MNMDTFGIGSRVIVGADVGIIVRIPRRLAGYFLVLFYPPVAFGRARARVVPAEEIAPGPPAVEVEAIGLVEVGALFVPGRFALRWKNKGTAKARLATRLIERIGEPTTKDRAERRAAVLAAIRRTHVIGR